MSILKEARKFADDLLIKFSKGNGMLSKRVRNQLQVNNEKGGQDTMKNEKEIISETEEDTAAEPEEINSNEEVPEEEGEKEVQEEPAIVKVQQIALTQDDINNKVLQIEATVNKLIQALQGDKK